jgi:hypothetical protein
MKNLSDEALLKQLGYVPNESLYKKLKSVIDKTQGYTDIKQHLLALHDNLKGYNAFVALSSTKDYFKVKNEASVSEADAYIHRWAEKYKVALEKVEGKETYYIIGKKA